MKSLTCVLLGVRLDQWSFLLLKSSIEKMSFFWISGNFFKELRLCKLLSVFTQKWTFYSRFLLSVHVGNHHFLGGRLRRLLEMRYKPLWLPCKEVKMLKSMIGVVVMRASGKSGAGSKSKLPWQALYYCNFCRIWPSVTAARQNYSCILQWPSEGFWW